MKDQSQEDYLRAIYQIIEQEKERKVKSVDIAARLNISKAAVSKMLKILQSQGFVSIELYSKVNLTKKGLMAAQKLTYKYGVIEVFLKNVLKVDKESIKEEAHRLEHAFSDETIKKLVEFLNNSKVCSCGKEIFITID